MKRMIALCSVLMIVGLALVIGANVWYTRSQVQHECQALKDLTAKPVTYPANPSANPSRVATYNFYIALLDWERSDGC
jgi:hypothetical protein